MLKLPSVIAILFFCLLVSVNDQTANGQEKTATPASLIGNQDASDKEDSLNEQTIYIPYDKLREVFERDGRGVFLPYEKFQQLWEQARSNQPKKTDTGPPLGALITDIESVATLGTEIVNVDAVIKIELLKTRLASRSTTA